MTEGKSRSPMGSHKHGVSGAAGKSPKFRHAMKREAEKQERKRKDRTKWFGSVPELMHDR